MENTQPIDNLFNIDPKDWKRLSWLSGKIEDIFSTFNNEVCSNCPMVRAQTLYNYIPIGMYYLRNKRLIFVKSIPDRGFVTNSGFVFSIYRNRKYKNWHTLPVSEDLQFNKYCGNTYYLLGKFIEFGYEYDTGFRKSKDSVAIVYKYRSSNTFGLYRNNPNAIYSKECGCCSLCANRRGYLRTIEDNFNILKSKYWVDDIYGFFDNSKKRCNLPRVYRSRVCSNYVCPHFNMRGYRKLSSKIALYCEEILDIKSKYNIPR